MVKNETVIIVGAGASHEARLPTGAMLTERISEIVRIEDRGLHVDGDRVYLEALRRITKNQSSAFAEYVDASRQIEDAMPQVISIDNFIDMHAGDVHIATCGKLAIVKSILEAERRSLLYVDPSNTYNTINFGGDLRKTWYSAFIKLLTENCRDSDLSERLQRLTLVVFNYDRCIEHYLYRSFPNLYRRQISDQRAAELVSEIDILHPYGVVGSLPWQSNARPADFGREPSASDLVLLKDGLSTYTEELRTDQESVERIRDKVRSARYLIFLGFSFQRQNMNLLFPDRGSRRIRSNSRFDVFATGVGMSKSAREVVKADLQAVTGAEPGRVHVEDLTCSSLFHEYWYQLALR